MGPKGLLRMRSGCGKNPNKTNFILGAFDYYVITFNPKTGNVSHEIHGFYYIFIFLGGMRKVFSSDLLSLMTAWSVLSMLVT